MGAGVEVNDFVCVGLNCSSLAVAVAIADVKPALKVKILDNNANFTWHGRFLFPDHRLQNNFMRDLITASNPRSFFTFVNYLHQKKQLAAFTNVSSMRPSRMEMHDYLKWCAGHLESLGWVEYGKQVTRVEPVKGSHGKVIYFKVHFRDQVTSKESYCQSQMVLVSVNSISDIPQVFKDKPEMVSDTSSCQAWVNRPTASSIAIVGASQQAAEIFESLQDGSANSSATWFVQDWTIRPFEETPFYASLGDGTRHMRLPPDLRHQVLQEPSRRSRVTLELIERIYEKQHAQRLAGSMRFNIQLSTAVIGCEIATATPHPQIRLQLRDTQSGIETESETFDHVIVADGQRKGSGSKLLGEVAMLTETGKLDVGSDYRVNCRKHALAKDCNVWLLGTLADPGNHDEGFLHLAEQGQRVSRSVLDTFEPGTRREEANVVSSVL